jgi:GMP synthase (glutamine-hydrolysing)
MLDQLLVLNFSAPHAASIAARLRAEKIYCRILPGSTPVDQLTEQQALGIILAGGITGDTAQALDGRLLRTGMPVLALGDTAAAVGLLMGAQLQDRQDVNDVATLTLLPSRITGEGGKAERYMGTVSPMALTDDLQPLALRGGDVVGFCHATHHIYALQSQLESNDPDMMNLLLRFAQDVCGATRWWGAEAFIASAKADILAATGEGRALCVMSGGLDTGVAALLAHRALGNRLQCLFVDTGLLRENEAENFSAHYRGAGLNLMTVQAGERFFGSLQGKLTAQEKTDAMRSTMEEVLREAVEGMEFSLIIDAISADTLLGGAPRPRPAYADAAKASFSPLAELFKDEVRQVGEALGLPQDITRIQPFPWTGLALRVLGECTALKISVLRRADAIFREEVQAAGLHKRLHKYFAIMMPSRCEVGEGELVVALRAVSASHQGADMRAMPARLPYDLLERYAERVLGMDKRVTRVVYDLTPAANPQQVEWT